MKTWKVTIYRRDSHTPVTYDNVKHTWTEGNARYVVAQYTTTPEDGAHHYWVWPWDLISHVKEERMS